MIKLLFYAAVLSAICRMALGKWPWDYLRRSSPHSQAVVRARKLLAVHETATRQEIVDAHRRRIALVHPDRGGSNAEVHAANAARDLLLDQLSKES